MVLSEDELFLRLKRVPAMEVMAEWNEMCHRDNTEFTEAQFKDFINAKGWYNYAEFFNDFRF